ncbi:hypothetical protein [Paraglaciecola aestuariivivens]
MLLATLLSHPSLAKETVKPLPSADFLEFLAELQKIDGKWVSPLDVQPQPEKTAQPLDAQAAKLPPKKAAPKPRVQEPKS